MSWNNNVTRILYTQSLVKLSCMTGSSSQHDQQSKCWLWHIKVAAIFTRRAYLKPKYEKTFINFWIQLIRSQNIHQKKYWKDDKAIYIQIKAASQHSTVIAAHKHNGWVQSKAHSLFYFFNMWTNHMSKVCITGNWSYAVIQRTEELLYKTTSTVGNLFWCHCVRISNYE